jgi:hypothetical protein
MLGSLDDFIEVSLKNTSSVRPSNNNEHSFPINSTLKLIRRRHSILSEYRASGKPHINTGPPHKLPATLDLSTRREGTSRMRFLSMRKPISQGKAISLFRRPPLTEQAKEHLKPDHNLLRAIITTIRDEE